MQLNKMYTFRPYIKSDLPILRAIWNDILEDGIAFPGLDLYDTDESFNEMLKQQDAVNCILVNDTIMGYYILHPNNIGRCSHVGNCSYCMSKTARGKKLGKPLVQHSIDTARKLNFKGLQFNAVVASNLAAIHIYTSLGFSIMGTIPNGFLLKDNTYSDMHIMYLEI